MSRCKVEKACRE